jgi:hypothetical protein
MPSTAIRRLEYDVASRTLSVWFVPSGRRYDYVNVPASLFKSPHIRDHSAYRRVA